MQIIHTGVVNLNFAGSIFDGGGGGVSDHYWPVCNYIDDKKQQRWALGSALKSDVITDCRTYTCTVYQTLYRLNCLTFWNRNEKNSTFAASRFFFIAVFFSGRPLLARGHVVLCEEGKDKGKRWSAAGIAFALVSSLCLIPKRLISGLGQCQTFARASLKYAKHLKPWVSQNAFIETMENDFVVWIRDFFSLFGRKW